MSPAAVELIMAGQRQVRGGVDAAGVVRHGRAGAFREQVLGDGIGIIAVGAARDRTLGQGHRLADDQRRVEAGRRRHLGVRLDLRQHERRVRGAGAPAVVQIGGKPLIEARVRAAGARPVAGDERQAAREVDLRDGRLVGSRDGSGPRSTAFARCSGSPASCGTVRAPLAGDVGVTRSCALIRGLSGAIRREIQALPGGLHRRRHQLDLGRRRGTRGIRPVADPRRQDLAAGARIGEPAIVAAADLHDHRRGGGLRQVDDRVGLRIGEVHIVAAREVRHLRGSGRIVALAAAILPADVVPQIDLEGLYVRRRRRGARIGVGAARGSARGQRRVAGTAAAAGRKAERGRENEHPDYACRFHDQFPMQ